MYTWLQAIEWRHLPEAGGLLDQPDLLMRNVFMMMMYEGYLEHETKAEQIGY